MTQDCTQINDDTGLADTVEAYLIEHPNFLETRPTLLKNINVPHFVDGADSLIEKQVKALRLENRTLRDTILSQINAASDNEKLLNGIEALVQALLKADNYQSFAQSLFAVLKSHFTITQGTLALSNTITTEPAPYLTPLDNEQIISFIHYYFASGNPFCDRTPAKVNQLLFAHKPSASCALIPLGTPEKTFGILAMGSTDENQFNPDDDTLFLKFIEKIATAILRKLSLNKQSL